MGGRPPKTGPQPQDGQADEKEGRREPRPQEDSGFEGSPTPTNPGRERGGPPEGTRGGGRGGTRTPAGEHLGGANPPRP